MPCIEHDRSTSRAPARARRRCAPRASVATCSSPPRSAPRHPCWSRRFGAEAPRPSSTTLRAACRTAHPHRGASRVAASSSSARVRGRGRSTPRTRGTFAGFGLPLEVGLGPGATARSSCPRRWPSALGCCTTPSADEATARAYAVADPSDPELRGWDGTQDEDVAAVLLGEGSARRTLKAPGYLDPRAEPFDAAVADALRQGRSAAAARPRRPRSELLQTGARSGSSPARPRRPGLGRRVAVRRRAVRRRLLRRVVDAALRVVAVVGPTATGKSDLAVALAQHLGGEIVNADSMQLYAGMDIGTAKLAPDERGGVPHHLLDIWPLAKSAAVAEYQARAREAIREIATPRPHARPGRRVGAVPAWRAGPARVPGGVAGGPRRALRRAGRARARGAARPAGAAGPRRRRGDPAEQRPAHRPRAGGDHRDRAAVPGPDARVRVDLRHRAGRARPRPTSTSGSSCACTA